MRILSTENINLWRGSQKFNKNSSLRKLLTFGTLHPMWCCHIFGLVCMLVPDLSCLWIAPYGPTQPESKEAQMKIPFHFP